MLLREQLSKKGLDAGAHTIAWHLQQHHNTHVSPATIWRTLKRAGLIEPEPKKRPKSSSVRFEADLPNQCWQSDFTHFSLVDGSNTEILSWLDDCTRFAISLTAHKAVTTPIVVATFRLAAEKHGNPASTLTDNGMASPSSTQVSGAEAAATPSKPNCEIATSCRRTARPRTPRLRGRSSGFSRR